MSEQRQATARSRRNLAVFEGICPHFSGEGLIPLARPLLSAIVASYSSSYPISRREGPREKRQLFLPSSGDVRLVVISLIGQCRFVAVAPCQEGGGRRLRTVRRF